MTGSVSGHPAGLGTPPWVAGDRPILAPRPVWGPRLRTARRPLGVNHKTMQPVG
jgi:hypothetical protein